MLIVVLFWDTYRITALCVMTLVYFLIGVVALWRLSQHKKADPPGVRGNARGARARSCVSGEPIHHS
jgi:uncharacterized membrane protein YqjE